MQSARRLYEASLAIQKQFRNAGRYFGWAVFALGLIGFIAHQEAYAICFILLGFSVAVSPTDEDTMQRKLASTAAAAVAVFWALATTYVFFAAASANSPFVYMTPTIAIAVMALGICLVAIDTKSPSLRASIQLIASLATLSGIFVLIAYGFEVRQVFEARAISRIPLSAAAAIAISGLAILLLRPDRGFIKLFVSSKLGGTATRSALP